MNRPIILFRFHEQFELCRERVELLSVLNPGVPIYGVYGGPPEAFAQAAAAVGDLLVDLRPAEVHDAEWQWLHMDLHVKHWYRDLGQSVPFDVLFDHEWDLLTTEALTSIYPQVDQNTIALCSLTRLVPELERHYHWTAHPAHRPAYRRFLKYMRDTFDMGPLEYISLGPGSVLPRRFLEEFAQLEDVDSVHSEISYPAFAQVLGFNLVNNNLRSAGVDDQSEDAYFHCEPDRPIASHRIVSEMMKPDGRRAFHPVKYSFTKDRLRELERARRKRRFAQKWGVGRARVRGSQTTHGAATNSSDSACEQMHSDAERPLVSVIIACRNGERYVHRQLEALASQQVSFPWELVYVDNGSTDRSVEVVKGYTDRIQLRVVLAPERAGQSYARNVGADVARADNFVFVDADDEVAPGFLASMAEMLQEHEFVGSLWDEEALNPDWVRHARDTSESSHGTFSLFAFGGAVGVSRPALQSVGGWPEEYRTSEDMVLSFRLRQRGIEPVLLPEPMLRVRFRDSIWGIFRQTCVWGSWIVRVHRDFGHDFVPRRSASLAVAEWTGVLRQLVTARNKADFALFAARAGYSVGRFLGSVRWRVAYL